MDERGYDESLEREVLGEKPVAGRGAESEAHRLRDRADRHLVQLQEQGLCGAEERHRVDGHLSQPQRHPARRTPARAGFRHQPHAGARGDGAARARGLRALGAAPRRLCRAQDQEGGDRADHRLGGAGKHGGAPDHPERAERRRYHLAAQDVRDLRGRAIARASRRIFRGEYRIPPVDHPHERQFGADRSRRKPVHAYAHDPQEDHRRKRIASIVRSAIT